MYQKNFLVYGILYIIHQTIGSSYTSPWLLLEIVKVSIQLSLSILLGYFFIGWFMEKILTSLIGFPSVHAHQPGKDE